MRNSENMVDILGQCCSSAPLPLVHVWYIQVLIGIGRYRIYLHFHVIMIVPTIPIQHTTAGIVVVVVLVVSNPVMLCSSSGHHRRVRTRTQSVGGRGVKCKKKNCEKKIANRSKWKRYENRVYVYDGIKRDWLPNMVQLQWFLRMTTYSSVLCVCVYVPLCVHVCRCVCVCVYLCVLYYTYMRYAFIVTKRTCHRVRDLIGEKSGLRQEFLLQGPGWHFVFNITYLCI